MNIQFDSETNKITLLGPVSFKELYDFIERNIAAPLEIVTIDFSCPNIVVSSPAPCWPVPAYPWYPGPGTNPYPNPLDPLWPSIPNIPCNTTLKTE